MSERTRLGFAIFIAAIALGVLGDRLLWVSPWGLNVGAWAAALAAAVAALLYWGGVRATGGGRWLVVPLLFFAAAFAGRDSITLQVCNILALLCALALAAMRLRAGRVVVAGTAEYVLLGLLLGLHTLLGPLVLLADDVRWHEMPRTRWQQPLRAIGCGVVLAVPLLLVFGGLFMAADAVFEGYVRRLLEIDLSQWFEHGLVVLLFGWIASGILRAGLVVEPAEARVGEAPRGITLGITELGTALGLLNVLFLAFVLVQLRYLFDFRNMVSEATGLTYAEWARRGFFELVAVAALVLPLLLAGHWLLRRDRPHAERAYRILAGLLVALLFVIMASALLRMGVYQHFYGLTELRVYTTAFMAWLAMLLAWFVVTVLAGKRERFAFGAMVTGMAVIAALNALGPDALIVSTNLARTQAAVPFDTCYASSLNADAVPLLVDNLGRLPEGERAYVADQILRRWTPPGRYDWRTYNFGRMQAYWAVANHWDALQAAAAGAKPAPCGPGYR